MLKKIRVGVILITLAFGALFLFHNCSQARFKHQVFPEIGTVVKLEVKQEKTSNKADSEYKNILVQFFAGGRTLSYDEDSLIRLYGDSEASELLYEFTPQQLKHMHEGTECPEELWSYLENSFLGDALFCNSSIDLSRVKLFVYVRPNKANKTATSYNFEYADDKDDFLAITVGF